MKEVIYLLGILVAGALGYKYEPSLRFQLTGTQPESEIIHETVEIEVPVPAAPKIDLSTLAPSQLPEKVLLTADAKVADSSSGLVMTIEKGNHVKLVRIEGEEIVISPGQGPFVGKVAVSETDLLKQLAAKPPSPVTPAAEPAPEQPAVAAQPVIPANGDTQEPAAVPAPAAEPAPAAPAPEMAATPETAPAAEPAATPEPAPAPEAAAPAPAGAGGDVVKAMQESIRASQIKEFTFDQVLNWEASADEAVDGETYQTGLASYKAETIFGVKTIQAKALLKGGKVQRWIWPKSGMEIK